MSFISFRLRLGAFQAMRGNPPDPGFVADLDLSIRLGTMVVWAAILAGKML